MTSPPSNMGWPAGYVPTASEWAESQSAKVDFPAPLDQGGTGGLSSFSASYNIVQRQLVTTTPVVPAALTRYAAKTSALAITFDLPPVNSLASGDWIDIVDVDSNAATNHITLAAHAGDTITYNGASASSLDVTANGAYVVLTVEGDHWAMTLYSTNTLMPVEEGGVTVITAQAINFVGTGVGVADGGGGVAVVTIPGSAPSPVNVRNNGSFINAATTLNFTGPIVVATDAGSGTADIAITTSTPPITVAGTTHTVSQTEDAQYLLCTNAGAVTVTLPLNATTPIDVGFVTTLEQNGAGTVTISPAGGVTLHSRAAAYATAGQYSVLQVKKVATDTWTLIGDAA